MNGTLQLEAIESLDDIFERNGIDYWLFGGWAVDFHAGRMTRDHADIDVAIWRTDAVIAARWLVRHGWAHAPGAEQDGYTTYTRDDVQVDLAFLARGEDGTVYTPLKSGRGVWPPGSFGSDVRRLAGRRARVVTVASLIADKSQLRDDPISATKDAADVGGASLRRNVTRPRLTRGVSVEAGPPLLRLASDRRARMVGRRSQTSLPPSQAADPPQPRGSCSPTAHRPPLSCRSRCLSSPAAGRIQSCRSSLRSLDTPREASARAQGWRRPLGGGAVRPIRLGASPQLAQSQSRRFGPNAVTLRGTDAPAMRRGVLQATPKWVEARRRQRFAIGPPRVDRRTRQTT